MQSNLKCLNEQCSYHAQGKCSLFPGWSFLHCRRAPIATRRHPTTNKPTNKKEIK